MNRTASMASAALALFAVGSMVAAESGVAETRRELLDQALDLGALARTAAASGTRPLLGDGDGHSGIVGLGRHRARDGDGDDARCAHSWTSF